VYHDPVTDVKVSALRGLDLFIKEGEVASIIGPSGAGKSTLVKILSGILKPSGGSVYIGETNIAELNEKNMRKFRFERMGIVNQYVHQNLLSNLTVEKNIMLPMKMRYVNRQTVKKDTDELIELLNLSKIRTNPVTKISGGEAVRTSIGVALAKKPTMLLADEPTGQLDTANTNDIIATFKDLNEQNNTTILVVTHDLRFRNAFKKSFIIRDGRLVGVNLDVDRSELEFILRPQESTLQSVIDSSQFVRLPDEVYVAGNYKHMVEFDIHPSKKITFMFNPSDVSADQIQDILDNYSAMEAQPDAELKQDEEGKVSFDEIRPLLEQQFEYPKNGQPIIEISNLCKSFPAGRITNDVLKDVSFTVSEGDFVVISGKSGAGKTTLMNVVSGVETPDDGEIKIKDFDIVKGDSRDIANFRFNELAMISQVNNLFKQYTVQENMIIPRIFNSANHFTMEDVPEIAESVEIDHKLSQYGVELSAGERQRAALAIALARKAPIIFADEPTANVDSRLARNIITLLMETAKQYGTTIIEDYLNIEIAEK
jgi:ABC-type lipoprotein export system ATPase subunit